MMKQQWNKMALVNPFFGITSWPEFENPEQVDLDFFWKTGAVHACNLLAKVPQGDTHGLSMLEIGCGMGRMTHYFAQRFARVMALDISPEMVERARQYWSGLDNVEFLEGNGVDLDLVSNASVDFVLSFYVLNHATDPDTVLSYVRETGRVLRPGRYALLHMRVCDLPVLSAAVWRSRLRQALRPAGAGFWWNEGIQRSNRVLTTDVEARFSQNEAWHGCEVPWARLQHTLAKDGLAPVWTDIASAASTHFAFLVLRKRPA